MPATHDIIIALLLTTVAGLSTGIGALVAFFTRATDTRVLSAALGLSAGVMVYVSMMELLPEAFATLGRAFDERTGEAVTLLTFFGGIALIALIDHFVPVDETPHEMPSPGELSKPADGHHMRRTAMMLTLAIGIHNFPEGMATFISALDGPDVALPIVVAIAIHNIPEGIAVSVPIYHSSGSRKKAFVYTLVSGLAETVGAIVGMAFLFPFWTPEINAYCLAAVAGVMVYISFDELLPGAERYGHHHIALGGVIAGMAIMALTLLIL